MMKNKAYPIVSFIVVMILIAMLMSSCTNTYKNIITEKSIKNSLYETGKDIALTYDLGDVFVDDTALPTIKENKTHYESVNKHYTRQIYTFSNSTTTYAICYNTEWIGDDNGIVAVKDVWIEECNSQDFPGICDSVLKNTLTRTITTTNVSTLSERSILAMVIGIPFGSAVLFLLYAYLRNRS